MMTSLLLRGATFLLTIIALLVGYLGISQIELSGWFTPPFYTDLSANRLSKSVFLLILGFFGYVTANLIDRVMAAQVAEAARRPREQNDDVTVVVVRVKEDSAHVT